MRVRRDHAIALFVIRYGQGHQRAYQRSSGKERRSGNRTLKLLLAFLGNLLVESLMSVKRWVSLMIRRMIV